MSATLHRALSRDPKIKLGSLVAPSGRCTQFKGETLVLLLTTHFPNLEVIEEVVAPATACRVRCRDWRVAARVVTYWRVERATDSFAPHKSPEVDGIFTALLQEGWRVVVPYLVRMFCTCLATGCVQAIWHQVKVVFIPKPSRNSYCGPRDKVGHKSGLLLAFLLDITP